VPDMKILYLHCNQPCYVAEPLFHGLRSVLGNQCVDVPRYDSLYQQSTKKFSRSLRGEGFTLYGQLKDDDELINHRYFWLGKLDEYDYVVIANIWDMGDMYLKIRSLIPEKKIVLIDGYDQPNIYPFAKRYLKNLWPMMTIIRKSIYFKREFVSPLFGYGLQDLIPRIFHPLFQCILPIHKKVKPISFSIPAGKITQVDWLKKTKDFPTHIVDQEIATNLKSGFYSKIASDKYCFNKESEYYEDLKKTRWGITTRRAGWDCLRHYELAANGCILCFRDLDDKPITAAPHGLNSTNSISYSNHSDLLHKIRSINCNEGIAMQERSYKWVRQQTTNYRANYFLQQIQEQ